MYLRITKYNPLFRNEDGYYTKNDWIGYTQIGKIFNEKLFTYDEYEECENKYLSVVRVAIEASKVNELLIEKLEIFDDDPEPSEEVKKILKKGKISNSDEAVLISQAILRLFFWAELNSPNNKLSITFGYDYYMYIETEDENVIAAIKSNLPDGMFIG
jgi:hypothetical protein